VIINIIHSTFQNNKRRLLPLSLIITDFFKGNAGKLTVGKEPSSISYEREWWRVKNLQNGNGKHKPEDYRIRPRPLR
jgi:hypothetical protein